MVYGRVIRVDSGPPPADAVVRLWPDSTAHHLNTGGTFRFLSADSGTHTLEVRAVGFERVTTTLETRPTAGTEVLAVLAPAVANFDECGLVMSRVRRWHIGLP
jgi:hypothetical protein